MTSFDIICCVDLLCYSHPNRLKRVTIKSIVRFFVRNRLADLGQMHNCFGFKYFSTLLVIVLVLCIGTYEIKTSTPPYVFEQGL